MDGQQELKRLRQEMERVERQMKDCPHDFADPVSDPEIRKEPISEMRMQGVDVFYETVGYSDKIIPRWSRKCKKCGKVEYSYKQEPIITGYKPKF